MLNTICFAIIALASVVMLVFAVFSTRKTNQYRRDIIEWGKLSRGENSEVRCLNCAYWVPTSGGKGLCRNMNVDISGTNYCNVWVRKKGSNKSK